jgi:hypothetical protein
MSFRRVSRMTKKLRDEADEIASIRKYLIVNRLIAGGYRGSFDLKDRRTESYLKGRQRQLWLRSPPPTHSLLRPEGLHILLREE